MAHQFNQTWTQTTKPFARTTFFTPDKTRSNAFFRDTRVDSCKYVMVKNGQSRAVPFRIINARGRGLNHYKTVPEASAEVKSVYMKDYQPVPNMHAGMGKKPLMPYDPESYRSRLSVNSVVTGNQSRSTFELGNSGMINRKQWASTYRDTFRWPRMVPISNPGICSDMAKRSHMKLNSIDF